MSKSMLTQKTVAVPWDEWHEYLAMKTRLESAAWHLQRALDLLDEGNIKQQAKDVGGAIEQKINAARRVA